MIRTGTADQGDDSVRMPGRDGWHPDTVIPGYECKTVALASRIENDAIATFVRKQVIEPIRDDKAPGRWMHRLRSAISGKDSGQQEQAPSPRAIMYVHGWNDYFYRTHVAEFWESLGVRFYAVDLRRYGRSLRPDETPGYIEDLHEYSVELNALRDEIVDDLGDRVQIMLVAHSQGGLISSLWMNAEHPDHVTALALNSPWLELQGNRMLRIVSTPVLKGLLLRGGRSVLPIPDPGFYQKTILHPLGGEWEYDAYPFEGEQQFVPRAGWLEAIYRAQSEISGGLDISVPVLVSTSDRSMMQLTWDEKMREADTVLDVVAIREAAIRLGDLVTLARIKHGIHDLSMSFAKPRREYFSMIAKWAADNAWNREFDDAGLHDALDAVSDAGVPWTASDSGPAAAQVLRQDDGADEESGIV